MYDAYHRIENISSDEAVETYDVVGPICESSDVFGKDVELNKAHRGDFDRSFVPPALMARSWPPNTTAVILPKSLLFRYDKIMSQLINVPM